MSSVELPPEITNRLDIMKHKTTIVFMFGYFRKNGFLDYRCKCDDFISIILTYVATKNTILIGSSNKSINNVELDFTKRVTDIFALNKDFFIVVNDSKILFSANIIIDIYIISIIIPILIIFR